MKKLLMFLIAAIMMIGVVACGEEAAEIKAVTEAVQGTTAKAPTTAAATTKAKSSEEEDGIDAGVVNDVEGNAEDVQEVAGE